MRYWILNILCAAFIGLFIFLVYSYIRSYFPEHWRLGLEKGKLVVLLWDGQVHEPSMEVYDPGNEKFIGVRKFSAYLPSPNSTYLGFSSTKGGVIQGMDVQIIRIPLWLPLLLTAIITTLLLIARRRFYHRAKSGQCLHCGYDLRESKDKCPECGTAVPAIAPASS